MQTLYELYKVHSPSTKEKKMREFIKDYVRRNIEGAVVDQDRKGNVYVTRGESETYPCVVAHMDQVQDIHSKDFRVWIYEGKLMGFSGSRMKMEGLGADDKNGIWVALKCLEKYDVMKCAFFVGEEIGCEGSSVAKMSFFDDCRWVIQCDRRNGCDLITDASGTELCSKEFVEAIQPERFGYKEEMGMMTDVMTLKENGLNVSCVNLSCGYYRPHTDEEFTVVSELENCLAFVEWIVENVTDVYPHKYEYKTYNYYGCRNGSSAYSGSGYWDKNGRWVSYNSQKYKYDFDWDEDDSVAIGSGGEVADDADDTPGDEWMEAYDFCLTMLESYPSMSEEELDEQLRYHYPSITKVERGNIIYCSMMDMFPDYEESNAKF